MDASTGNRNLVDQGEVTDIGSAAYCPDGSWIELGGCGMVHPNVLRAGGLDPEEWSGFAFGFGIDRMAKERHGVDDIREMYTNDIRFLEQFS